jgi:hypothetical protein
MSELKTALEAALDKAIDKICPNKFHDLTANHCAHFVSHMTDLDFSFNCVEFKGGTKQPANVRVHEIFERCPKVGKFEDADKTKTQLVFVTRRNNVNLSDKKMGNIPQKHIGVFCDGMIYHYSNTPDKVVKWTPQKFLDTFQAIYTGDQGLFFGTIPGSDLLLDIEPTGASVTNGIPFRLEKRDREWFAKALSGADQDEFLVGSEVNQPAQGFHGIHIPVSKYYGEQYNPVSHTGAIDHWAHVIDATAQCESRGFMNLVNSYDRAKFTFGFYQLAAHTPNDNLILLFRELVALPRGKDYFPELRLHNGRLHRVDGDGGRSDLEELFEGQLQFFMNFLNPRRRLIDEQEILHAARLMHWTANDPVCRSAQVRVSAEILQRKVATRYHPSYNLHGRDDTICTIIADIHHHGRASKDTVKAALRQSNKEKALLSVNNPQFQARNDRLAAIIKQMKDAGALGKKVYDAAANEFVDK